MKACVDLVHTCAGEFRPTKRSCCRVRSTELCFCKFWRAFEGPQSASAMATENKGHHRMLEPKKGGLCEGVLSRQTPLSFAIAPSHAEARPSPREHNHVLLPQPDPPSPHHRKLVLELASPLHRIVVEGCIRSLSPIRRTSDVMRRPVNSCDLLNYRGMHHNCTQRILLWIKSSPVLLDFPAG
jgi:hypothetical protein